MLFCLFSAYCSNTRYIMQCGGSVYSCKLWGASAQVHGIGMVEFDASHGDLCAPCAKQERWRPVGMGVIA